jgi:genome maintenance exonuclease 1
MTGRSYQIDGIQLPSVTAIIGQTLPNHGIAAWKLRVGEDEARRVSKEATDWGTGIHALVEAVNRGNQDTLTGEQRALVAPYEAWRAEQVDLVIGVEKLLVSRHHGYAGTTDAIVIMRGDDRPTLIDFKTSASALGMDEWALQTAAYCIAASEHLGLMCRRRIIVRLARKEPETLYVHEIPEDELETDKAAFLALLDIWKWQQSREGNGRKPSKNSLGRITFRRKS